MAWNRKCRAGFLIRHFRFEKTADFRFFLSSLFLKNYKRLSHQIFRDDRSHLVDVHYGVEHVGRHFRSSPEVIVNIKNIRNFQNLYFKTKSIPVDKVSFVVSKNIRPTGNRFVNFRLSSKNFSFS